MAVDENNTSAVTNQDQTQASVNPEELLEIRKPTAQEAMNQARNSGTGKSIVSSLEDARARGDSRLVATYERQLNSLAESMAKQNVVAVDRRTNKVIDTVSERWANRPVVGGAEAYLKNKHGTKLLIENEADRILANSNTISSVTIARVDRTPEGFVAVTNTGDRYSPRASEAQAIEEASEWFGVGEKVAETAEQKAALTNLAVRVKQFGGRTVGGFGSKLTGDILRQAMPDVADSERRRLASTIQPAVKVDRVTGQAYTTYGAGLTIQLNPPRGRDAEGSYKVDPGVNIVSPEGRRLNNFDFSMEQMLAYGISAEAALEGIRRYEEAYGSLDSPYNRARILKATLTAGVDANTFKNALLQQNRLRLQSDAAIDAGMAGSSFNQGNIAYNRALRQASQNPATIAYQNFDYADFFANPTDLAGLPEGFATKQFGDFYAGVADLSQIEAERRTFFNEDGTSYQTPRDLQKTQLEASAYEILTLAMPTADPTKVTQFTLPSWSLDSYTQELNNIYKTPNNNIQFGSNGLEYRFEDGTTRSWGTNVDDLNALPAMFNIEPAGGRQGELFWNARQFNSADEYSAWKQTYDARFDRPRADASQVQVPTAQRPVVEPPATDDLEQTSSFQPTQPVQPPSYGQQQPTGQQPVAPPAQTVTGPTGIQTPSGILGTFQTPLQTAGLSAVPQTVPAQTQGVSGFTQQQLTQTMPGTGLPNVGARTVTYRNQLGQTMPVTEINGQPVTFVPPGYTKQSQQSNVPGFNEGGSVESDAELDAMYRMATKFLGYRGPRSRKALEDFAKSSPAASTKMRAYTAAMARGGLVKGFQEGGVVAPEGGVVVPFEISSPTTEDLAQMQAAAVQQTMQPRQAAISQIAPQETDFIPTTAGQAAPVAPMAEAAALGQAQLAQPITPVAPAQVTPVTASEAVQQMTAATQAAQGAVSPQAQVQAAQQQQSSVTGLEAAQGTAIMMDNPVQREIQQGELISGVANAEKAAAFNEQIQAAQATPSKQATVQGQLETLMAQFEGGARPAWAAASMRNAMATLSARGLGASSLAGQAVIQATMEAALPVAQIDAQTQAQFEAQNLSNRQQRAMLAAQQRAEFLGMEFTQEFQARVANSSRIGDIANMNFTAEQQVALENSRAANTVNLQNLNNRQAKVMAEAAALSQLDMANLNNRQQAAVQNAQNFMQMDLSNLSNEQQTAMFKAQQNIQALFTDQAAENAAQQINAASENQTNQFFATLASQTSQFNAAQTNALEQFNINSVNALRKFNSEIQQQRDLFNAQNGLVIAQSNAQWRQNIATINNAAINESNREFAQTMNSLTSRNMDAIWQRERDIMSYAVQTANNNADRATEILRQKLANEASLSVESARQSSALAQAAGSLVSRVVLSAFGL